MGGDEMVERLDSFPFRHRVRDLMSQPLFALPSVTSIVEAAAALRRVGRSAVVTLDAAGRADGILTEQDIVRLIAERGAAGLGGSLGDAATRPVHCIPADALLYKALGRMDRLRVRHLVATDASGRALGLLSARVVLRTRAGLAPSLGDGIAEAGDAATLAELHERLPRLAEGLLAEGATAGEVAAVISGVNRDLAARAVTLAAQEVTAMWGPAPAAWCYLVLGSAGRDESLLAPDQDNALVHDGDEARDDAWFNALGERASDLLNAAGVPYCKGGVMAARPAWRHSLPAWRERLADWTARPEAENLLAIDIFYDFVPVAGEQALGEALAKAAAEAAERPALARLMAQQLALPRPPIGLFGAIRTAEGRVDLKRHGLYAVVAGARILALSHGLTERGTLARLAGARAAGALNEADHEGLVEAFRLFQDLILRQQIADLAAGRKASSRVAAAGLSHGTLARLKEALRRVAVIVETVQDAVLHG